MKPSARQATTGLLIAAIALIVVQVVVLDEVNTVTLVLFLFAALLSFGLADPHRMAAILSRFEQVKVPGVLELTVRAAERVERRTSGEPDPPDLPSAADDVTTSSRPGEGNSLQQFQEVRAKLEERLRFIRDAIFSMPEDSRPEQVVDAIVEKGLLQADELALVRDILGRVEDQIEEMPERLRGEYLDAGWRFSVRFGTLVFERLVHRELVDEGWLLLHFTQSRDHRPDVLAYREDEWRLIATRIQPSATQQVRERLQKQKPPFGAIATLVLPDSRAGYEPSDEFGKVEIVGLSELVKRA